MQRHITTHERMLKLYNLISDLYDQKKTEEEIKKFFDQQIARTTAEDVFPYVYSMKCLIGMGKLGIFVNTIKNFIVTYKHYIAIDNIWSMLEDSQEHLVFSSTGRYEGESREYLKQITVALIILQTLVDQQQFEQRIIDNINNGKLNPHIALAIFSNYEGDFHFEGTNPSIIFVEGFINSINIDFLYNLVVYILQEFTKSLSKQTSNIRDHLIFTLNEIYNSIPYGFSKDDFNLFLQHINDINENEWQHGLGMPKAAVLIYIKNQYQHTQRGYNFSLLEYDNLSELSLNEREKLKKIIHISKYKRKYGVEIEDFLARNPISLLYQVRKMYENGDIETDKIRAFIDQHLNEFSYEDMLDKVINVYVSERIQFALYIALQLKDRDTLLQDIQRNFKEGKINLSELKYLNYAYKWLGMYLGVKPDEIFLEKLENLANV